MSNQTQQSHGEILRVFTDWKSFYAPANLKDDEATIDLLVNYVAEKHGGVVSFTALNAAVAALGAQVLKPEPPRKTTEELAADFELKEALRVLREREENRVPFTERVAAEKVKREQEAWVKGQTTAKNELDTVITEYSCSHGPNRIDHTASQMVRDFLRKIRIPAPAGKAIDKSGTDYISTLSWVRAIKEAVPDHPRIGDCEKAMQRVREKFKAQAEAKARPDRNQGW